MRGEWIEIIMAFRAASSASASLPMRGEWIEILASLHEGEAILTSLPMRGEWIEMHKFCRTDEAPRSLPMRGEWIEMRACRSCCRRSRVSPHAGRVD